MIGFRLFIATIWFALHHYDSSFHWWALAAFAATFWSEIDWALTAAIGYPQVLDDQLTLSANSQLEYSFSLERALEHPVCDRFFQRLQAANIAPTATVEQWRELLVSRYEAKFPGNKKWLFIKYNIKSGMLFKNDKPEYADYIYHRIDLNYRDKTWYPPSGMPPIGSEEFVSFRVIVVNGFLRFEVGDFNFDHSPRILKDDKEYPIYQNWEAITVFPLMYYPMAHRIPVRYLSGVPYATGSMKESYGSGERQKVTKPTERRWLAQLRRIDAKANSDWKVLQGEFDDYRAMCRGGGPNYSKISHSFTTKANSVLQQEGWKKADEWGYRYRNVYGIVVFANLKGDDKRDWLADYREPKPYLYV